MFRESEARVIENWCFYRLKRAIHPGSPAELPAGSIMQVVGKEEHMKNSGQYHLLIRPYPCPDHLRIVPPHYFSKADFEQWLESDPVNMDREFFGGK